jgi:Fe-S cluster assembly ATP-binding protein
MTALLQIKDLYAGVAENKKEIIKGLNLTINAGEVHAIMGPNGAGKSTLSYLLAGKSDYEITSGEIYFDGKDLSGLTTAERANAGIFLSMQYPVAIPGVSVSSFLKHAVNAKRKYADLPELDAAEFLKVLRTAAKELGVSAEMLKREINVGFSGGEKKRLEILQMRLLEPKLAILDEADSGLDIDALRTVAEGVNRLHNKDNALLIITHHLDLLNLIEPDFVHIYADGHIVRSGDKNLAEALEKDGYKSFLEA